MSEVEENTVEEEVVSEPDMPVLPLFGKWDLTEVNIEDTTLEKYINLDAFQVPHTGGRHSKKRFGRGNLTVIERFINNLMRTEKYTGKKAQAYTVLKNSFVIIQGDGSGVSGNQSRVLDSYRKWAREIEVFICDS